MRRRKVEDVEKRGEYRRRYGLEQTGDEGGFGGFGTKKPGEDRRVEAQVLVAKAALEKEAARGGNTAGWVEEELKKIEEDAEREAVKEAEDLGAAVEQVQEKKPGWKVW